MANNVKFAGKSVSIDRRILGVLAIIFGIIIFIRPEVLSIIVAIFLIIYGIFEFAN